MYRIKLHDGTILDNLVLNGNNYVSSEIIEDKVFDNNMDTVTIINLDDNSEEIIEDAVLVANQIYNNESYIIIGKKTEEEKVMERIKKEISNNSTELTDVQSALVEIYEMLMNGGK